MNRARRDLVRGHLYGRRVDQERPVRNARETRVRLSVCAECRELRQRLAIVVELRLLLLCRVRNAIRAGKETVHVIETAVLTIDHHDGLDLREAILRHRWLKRSGHTEYGHRKLNS